jgi:hypothetical protein
MNVANTGCFPLLARGLRLVPSFALLLGTCLASGCADKRITLVDKLQTVKRVAIIDISENTRPEAGEFFTNEFLSVGFEVVERSNLDRIIKEGFAKNEYLDPQTLAEWGRGKAVQAIVLWKLVSVEDPLPGRDEATRQFSGWVRAVDVETSMILMTYNATLEVPVPSYKSAQSFEAYQRYAEMVCDDIARAMKRKRIRPAKPDESAPPVATVSDSS